MINSDCKPLYKCGTVRDAKGLLSKGEKVRVVGRNPDHLKALVARGAEPFTADLTDTASATKAFVGAKQST